MTLRSKILWLVCLLVAAVGYLIAYRPCEEAIAEVSASRENIAFALDENQALLSQRTELERTRAMLERTLRERDLHSDPRRLVALYIREAARVAGEHHVHIVALGVSAPVPSIVGAPSVPAVSQTFSSVPLDLVLDGSYHDLLATLCALSRTRVLANVDIASLERRSLVDMTAAPHLIARLHIDLNRLLPTGVDHVRT